MGFDESPDERYVQKVFFATNERYLMWLCQTEVDAKSIPLDKLTSASLAWCRRVGSAATTVSEARNDAIVLDAIQRSINRVNEAAVSHAQHIQKWAVLPRDFSVAGGELGLDLLSFIVQCCSNRLNC